MKLIRLQNLFAGVVYSTVFLQSGSCSSVVKLDQRVLNRHFFRTDVKLPFVLSFELIHFFLSPKGLIVFSLRRLQFIPVIPIVLRLQVVQRSVLEARPNSVVNRQEQDSDEEHRPSDHEPLFELHFGASGENGFQGDSENGERFDEHVDVEEVDEAVEVVEVLFDTSVDAGEHDENGDEFDADHDVEVEGEELSALWAFETGYCVDERVVVGDYC